MMSSSNSPPILPKEPYRYHQLEDGHVRLLRVFPDPDTSPIRCTLIDANLIDAGDLSSATSDSGRINYEAISYVWGDANNLMEVDCDGYSLSINFSLAEALQHFRYLGKELLWADGICINQADTQERGHQVQLMGLIYWQAQRVLIWLEPRTSDDEPEIMEDVVYFAGSLLVPDIVYKARDWNALRRILWSKWFERVWVVQEFGLAREAIFHYGPVSFDAVSLREALSQADENELQIPAPLGLYTRALTLGFRYQDSTRGHDRHRLASDPQSAESFLEILELARGLQCSDPRDTVYAFLGHPSAFKQYPLDPLPYLDYATNFTHRRPSIILPDYSPGFSVSDLFTNLALTVVQRDEGVELLHYVSHVGGMINRNSLTASWVPKWNDNRRTRFPHHVEVHFRTSLNFPTNSMEVLTEERSELHKIQLRAVLLDSVYVSSPIFAHDFESGLDFIRGNPALLGVYGCIDKLGDRLYDRHLSVEAQLITTLSAGLRRRVVENRIALDEFGTIATGERRYADLRFTSWSPIISIADGRRFFVTKEGRFGLGPMFTTGSHETGPQIGNSWMDQRLANLRVQEEENSNQLVADQIWLPMGATMPFILRPLADKRFKILGPCYLHGMMMGEAVKGLTESDFETITLV
jgi:hypothetical protein